MKRTVLAGVLAGLLLGSAVGLVRSTPSPGKTLSVRTLRARLMVAPQFLGSSVASLRRGDRVKLMRAKRSWYLVSYQGRQGWLHQNRVTTKLIAFRSGDTGSGTSRGEAELAGRGFSPATEKTFKEKNPDLDFSHLDTIQQFDVEPQSAARFAQEGAVAKKGGGR